MPSTTRRSIGSLSKELSSHEQPYIPARRTVPEATTLFVPNIVWDEVRRPRNQLLYGGQGTGKAEARIARKWRRTALVLLGHEGQRTLAAWRYVDPDETMFVLAKSGNQTMTEICLKENEFLMSHLGKEYPGEVLKCDMFDVLGARDQVAAWLNKIFERQDVTLSLVPFGPKPTLVGILLAILGVPWADVELVYPIPNSYNHNYSTGVSNVFALNLV